MNKIVILNDNNGIVQNKLEDLVLTFLRSVTRDKNVPKI